MEDDVPDLEDCSHLIKQRFKEKKITADSEGDIKITTINDRNNETRVTLAESAGKETVPETPVAVITSELKLIEKPKSQFGGMRKGFLLGPKSKSEAPSPPIAKVESMPFITKSAENSNSSLVMKEVQQQLIDKKSEWLTDDLLNKIKNSDDNFLSLLSNPEFGAILAEFQKNPQQAMIKYQNNKTITGFFTKFAQLMGEHFSKLGAKNM